MEIISPETAIGHLLDRQAAAICNRDLEPATINYAADVIIFDVVGPLRHPAGNSSVRKRLEEWFATFAPESPVRFEITDRHIEASDRLAFTFSLNHVHAGLRNGGVLDMFWRETLAWRKSDGHWKIVHAHSSVPFDPSTGMASTGLKLDGQ